MHRRALFNLLNRYLECWPEEESTILRIRALMNSHSDCFLRTCIPGHITGSAWIVSSDQQRCLLTHHRKLDRWLQLGGHADGETNVEEVALREAQEESGMTAFELHRNDNQLVPLDVDVHEIPAHGTEPAHEHHDIRFLLIAGPGQELTISDESKDLRWFNRDELLETTREESVLRMLRKAERALKA